MCLYCVRTYEVFETPQQTFTVMEYFPKSSILEYLGGLDSDSIWKYFRNLISAVEYCIIELQNFNFKFLAFLLIQFKLRS